MEVYRPKQQYVEAEHLESDVLLRHGGNKEFYIFGGDYLLKKPDGRFFPVPKDLFELLFEKEDTNERK